MLHSVFIALGANVNLWGLLRCRGGGCALHLVLQVFQHRFRGVFARNQRHLSKCFLPHGHDHGGQSFICSPLSSLSPSERCQASSSESGSAPGAARSHPFPKRCAKVRRQLVLLVLSAPRAMSVCLSVQGCPVNGDEML